MVDAIIGMAIILFIVAVTGYVGYRIWEKQTTKANKARSNSYLIRFKQDYERLNPTSPYNLDVEEDFIRIFIVERDMQGQISSQQFLTALQVDKKNEVYYDGGHPKSFPLDGFRDRMWYLLHVCAPVKQMA